MNLKHVTKLIAIALFINTFTGAILDACTITLINDTKDMVLVALKNQNPKKKAQKTQTPKAPQRQSHPQKLWVEPDTKIMFGDDTQHTCFDISVPTVTEKSQRAQGPLVYQRLCTISQHSCTMGKKIEIKVSDIVADTLGKTSSKNPGIDRNFFTVTIPKNARRAN